MEELTDVELEAIRAFAALVYSIGGEARIPDVVWAAAPKLTLTRTYDIATRTTIFRTEEAKAKAIE